MTVAEIVGALLLACAGAVGMSVSFALLVHHRIKKNPEDATLSARLLFIAVVVFALGLYWLTHTHA